MNGDLGAWLKVTMEIVMFRDVIVSLPRNAFRLSLGSVLFCSVLFQRRKARNKFRSLAVSVDDLFVRGMGNRSVYSLIMVFRMNYV